MESDQILRIIAKAWGRQKGWCFFPTIRGNCKTKKERILSYQEHKAFYWPRDRDKVIEHLEANRANDVYWCPSLFESPRRKMELAMDEHCLWADLDEVDPRQIDDYPPTIAWETSPGRYQALWLIAGGDIQGASWAGRENQQLTYHLGADQSGWDTTQLLRLPTWDNHKPDYRDKRGNPAHGKLLWNGNGRRQYLPDEFSELPEVPNGGGSFTDILEDEIEHVDRHAVWGRVRLKVSKRVREMVSARETAGDRSDHLWEIERELADAGCSVTEIVAIVRATVWNKFEGRSDELRRLTTEAHKAISARAPEDTEKLLEELEVRPKPVNLFTLIRNLKPPTWLIRDVLTQGAVGFIAGQPKSFKSWAGLDMALSVASGQPFLGHFSVETPGPVLYIQEEDSAPLIKARVGKVWPGKIADKLSMDDGELIWLPPQTDIVYGYELGNGLDIDGYIGQSFTISDESWQSWLDETLADKASNTDDGLGYRLLVMDPLMMMAGDVEENRAQEMTTKIFRPLKELARKWNVAIQMIHHMRKTDPKASYQRGGQLLLGSVANHAWAEDSMYFRLGRGGTIVVEQESKNAPVPGFTIAGINGARYRSWNPQVTIKPDSSSGDGETPRIESGKPSGNGESRTRHARHDKTPRSNAVVEALKRMPTGPHSAKAIAAEAGVRAPAIYIAEKRYDEIEKIGTLFQLRNKNSVN